MGILSGAKAEPTDPVRGFVNDVIDVVGFPRPEDALGTPADVVHQAGLPTVRDWLPMPADVGAKVLSAVRRGMPTVPRVPPPPNVFDIFPFPGESTTQADIGEREVAAESGNPPVGMKQRYYQRRI